MNHLLPNLIFLLLFRSSLLFSLHGWLLLVVGLARLCYDRIGESGGTYLRRKTVVWHLLEPADQHLKGQAILAAVSTLVMVLAFVSARPHGHRYVLAPPQNYQDHKAALVNLHLLI